MNAKYGKESPEDPDIIILEKVVGWIKLKNKSNIEIKSDFAKYNAITFDTKFYQKDSYLTPHLDLATSVHLP